MIEKLKAYLTMNNIPYQLIDNGNNAIWFSIEDMQIVANYQKEVDPFYFRMMLPNICSQQDVNSHILEEISTKYKCGKAVILNNQVWFSVETLTFGNVNYPQLFVRMISILKDMFNEFRRLSYDQH